MSILSNIEDKLTSAWNNATGQSSGIKASDLYKVNSTTNTNTNSTVKSDNGFCILASVQNSSADSYIKNYMAIAFDSSPSMVVKRNSNVTSYAVENGSDISDHVQKKNNTFTMSGIISETPIQAVQDLLYSPNLTGTRISQAITYLDKIYDSRQPIVLMTEYKIYDSVVLTGYTYDAKAEYSAQFDLTFEQVRIITSGTANVIATKTKSTTVKGKTTKTSTSSPDGRLQQSAKSITGVSGKNTTY